MKGKGFLEEGGINFVRRTRGLSTPKQKKGRALEMRWGTSLRGGWRDLLLGYFFEPRGFRVGVPYWAGPWAPQPQSRRRGMGWKRGGRGFEVRGGGMLEDREEGEGFQASEKGRDGLGFKERTRRLGR